MTATYNASLNALVELPQMPEPSPDDKPFREYDAYLASLRTIPAHDSCRGLWKDGQEVEENIHYQINIVFNVDGTGLGEAIAFPLPVKSEEDLWKEVLNIAMNHLSDGERAVMNDDSAIAELKEKYSLTKR